MTDPKFIKALNPYPPGTSEHRLWKDGYNAALAGETAGCRWHPIRIEGWMAARGVIRDAKD